MSKEKVERVQMKMNIRATVKQRLEELSNVTGFPMVKIVEMLVTYYGNPLDVEHDMRRMLKEALERNKQELKLTRRQKKVIEDNVTNRQFTKDLI